MQVIPPDVQRLEWSEKMSKELLAKLAALLSLGAAICLLLSAYSNPEEKS